MLTLSFEEGRDCDCDSDKAIGIKHPFNRINEIDSAFAFLYKEDTEFLCVKKEIPFPQVLKLIQYMDVEGSSWFETRTWIPECYELLKFMKKVSYLKSDV